MKPLLKDMLDEQFKKVKIDKKLHNKLLSFRLKWMQQSSDYISFLGSNLFGVERIAFTPNDVQMVLEDILGLDIKKLKKAIDSSEHINPSWKVSSDPYWLGLVYLMNRFMLEPGIDKFREEALKNLYFLFTYKTIGRLITNWLEYPVDPGTAKEVHRRLSGRFIIKQVASWQELFEYKSNDILPTGSHFDKIKKKEIKGGIHYERIKEFDTLTIINTTNDLQGRIREIVKNIYEVLVQVDEEKAKVSTTTLNQEFEGESSNKDIIERPDKYITFMNSVIDKPNDLIKHDLLGIIADILPNLNKTMLFDTLTYISKSKLKSHELTEPIMTLSLQYLQANNINSNYSSDIVNIIGMLKRYWSSSKVSSKEVKDLKKNTNDLVVKATNKRTGWLIATVTIGVLVYIFLRAIAKDSYK